MRHLIARLLWIDDRDSKRYEGQLMDQFGIKHYFNYSVCQIKPVKGQTYYLETDIRGVCNVAEVSK